MSEVFNFPVNPQPGDIVAFKDIYGEDSSYECIDDSEKRGCVDCEMVPCFCVFVDCVMYGNNCVYKKINNE